MQAYPLFKEEGLGANPLRIADIFNTLESYKEGSLQDLNKLHRYFKGSIEERRGNYSYTNKQFLERSFHWLVNIITFEGNLMPGKTPPSPEARESDSKALSGGNSRGRSFQHGRRVWVLTRRRTGDATGTNPVYPLALSI